MSGPTHDETAARPTYAGGSAVRDLWTARWLLLQWVRRDFTVRYRQSALGLAWAVVQPAMLLTFYGVVFVKVLGVRPNRGNYLVFAYCGLAPWTFIASAMSSSAQSLTASAAIIKQVYFPRSIVALSGTGVVVIDLLVSVMVLLVLQVVTARTMHASTLALIPIYAGLILLVGAAAVVMSVVGALVRDVRFALPLLLQVGFIATPVMYSSDHVGGTISQLLDLNPVAQVIEAVREAVIDGVWPSPIFVGGLIIAGVAALMGALAYCRSVEQRLPDLL